MILCFVMNGLVVSDLVVRHGMMDFVMCFLVDRFVINSLVVNWLNLNISDLRLVMSVLGNLNVALVSSLMSVNWLVVGLFDVVGLLNVVMSFMLVGIVLGLDIVVRIVLFCDSLGRNDGRNNERNSLHLFSENINNYYNLKLYQYIFSFFNIN